MNINDIIKYGHQTVLQAVEGFPDEGWEVAGAVGVWSVKDIMAHLASFEHVLGDVLHTLLDDHPTPHLDAFRAGNFNDLQVPQRRPLAPAAVVAEYVDAHEVVRSLVARIPPERCRESGTLPWYGAEYSLDDFVVYTSYGHKREHTAQIKLFRKRYEQR